MMANHELANELAAELEGKEIITGSPHGRSLGTITGHNGGGMLLAERDGHTYLRDPENIQTLLKCRHTEVQG